MRSVVDRRVRTLAALRTARQLTQVQMAETLGIGQGDVSKLEQRENLLLNTLARDIEATGGRLRIVAEYDGDRVEIDSASFPVGSGELIGWSSSVVTRSGTSV